MVVVYSEAYESWKNDALRILSQYKYRLRIGFPIILQCHFYVDKRGRRDISALYEGIQDCMVTAGIILDDDCNIVIGHDGSRVYYDKRNPRIEVSIFRATPKEKYMTMIQSFKCDGCDEVFTARDKDGKALPVGGIQGGFMGTAPSGPEPVMMTIDGDFCPVCFDKIVKFIFAIAEENKKK